MSRGTSFALLAGAPGVALAAVGLFHPHGLRYESAPTWIQLHLVGLFVFPLVGLALAALVRGRRDPVSWAVRLTAFVYATAYSALDVISGIGAGYVTWRLGEGAARPDEVRSLFSIGGRIGEVGSWALIVCAAVVATDALRRLGARAVPGVLLMPGAALVHVDHIFSPYGVLGMLLIGVGTGWSAWSADGGQEAVRPPARSRRSAGRGPGRR